MTTLTSQPGTEASAGDWEARTDDARIRHSRMARAFVVLALLALAVRLVFFIGYQGRDDRNYLAYAHHVASGHSLTAMDVQTQWVGRAGFWLPLAASMSIFGATEFAYVVFPLVLSIAGIGVALALGGMTVGRRAAVLAAALLAILPLDVLYATRAYPDLPLGVLMVTSYWLALRSRSSTGSWWSPCASGLVLGAAYLQKETALFAVVPIAVALRFWSRRHWRALSIIAVSLCVVMAAELVFWHLVKDDALYRFHAADAALKGVLDNLNGAPAHRWLPGPKPTEIYRSANTLLDAFLMLVANEEFGILYWLALPMLAVAFLRRDQATRDLRVWIAVLLMLILFFPVHWPRYTMPRDPRYLTCLAIPSLLLCAHYLLRMSVVPRAVILLLFVATGAVGIYLGAVSSRMEPQRSLLARARTGEHLWVTPQFGADLLLMSGGNQQIELGIHFLEQGPTAGSFQAARLIRPTLTVAQSPAEMTFGTLVLRDSRRAPPPGWQLLDRVEVDTPKLVAGAQAVLGLVGLRKFAAKLAPGGGVTATLYRRAHE